MGSYCSCSGTFKITKEIVLQNNSLNNKIMDSIPLYSSEKQEKKVKRFKTYNVDLILKKPEKKKAIVSQERISFISSSSCLLQHKVITNSKITKELINELYSIYKPLDDNISVEDIQLSLGEGMEYRGEWNKLTGERHGRGIYIIHREKIYLGYWKNDKMNGLGKQIYCEINIDNFENINILKKIKIIHIISENGRIITKKEKVKNHGQMEHIMKEIIKMEKNGEKENCNYLMVQYSLDNLKMEKLVVKEK